MHVRHRAITRDRFERRKTNRTNAFFTAFAEDPYRLGVKIDIGNIEIRQFAQAQTAAVKKLHNRDVAQRHPNRCSAILYDLERRSQQLLDLLFREHERKFLADLRQLQLAHWIVPQFFSLG